MSLQLPHSCRVGKISVYPGDWDQPEASTETDWYIHYRFHHPGYKEKYPKGFPVHVKGMNDAKGLAERRRITRGLIDNELANLQAGYNPHTKKIEHDIHNDYLIHPDTGLILALEMARDLHSGERGTKEGMKTVTAFLNKAAIACGLHKTPIGDVRRRHIMKLLQVCGEQKKVWSNSLYNFYVRNLGMLFKILVKVEATEVNAINGIELRKKTRRIRQVLTRDERKKVNEALLLLPDFHRFTHIFFHSGSRLTEMMRVRGCDVELHNQRFKRTIRKGSDVREVWTTIKDVALPYWEKAMTSCGPEQFVFSRGLRPGKSPMRPEQVTRRWKRYVKDKLGIDVDFYSLKHLNSTETVDQAGDQAAADQNAHTSTAMVIGIYDVARQERQHEKLKKVNNPLA